MKKVKGSMFIKIAKGIRADKTGVYQKLLSKEDRDFLSQNILSASWYPFDIYKRCFNALAEVQARGNKDVWIQWGRAQGDEMIASVYGRVVTAEDPRKAMQKLKIFFKLMYDFGTLIIDFISDNEMEFTYKDFDPDFEVSFIVGQAWIQRILELCGCKDVQSKFLVKSWEGAGDSKLHFSWI